MMTRSLLTTVSFRSFLDCSSTASGVGASDAATPPFARATASARLRSLRSSLRFSSASFFAAISASRAFSTCWSSSSLNGQLLGMPGSFFFLCWFSRSFLRSPRLCSRTFRAILYFLWSDKRLDWYFFLTMAAAWRWRRRWRCVGSPTAHEADAGGRVGSRSFQSICASITKGHASRKAPTNQSIQEAHMIG
jgi:hypothetical protein